MAMAVLACTDLEPWPQELTFMEDLEETMKCPICYDFMQAPMMLPTCDHTYCSLCIRKYLTQRELCPICGIDAPNNQLRSNHVMEKTIQQFKKIRHPLRSLFVDDSTTRNQSKDLDCDAVQKKKLDPFHHQTSSCISEKKSQNVQDKRNMRPKRDSSKDMSARKNTVPLEDDDSDVEFVSEDSKLPSHVKNGSGSSLKSPQSCLSPFKQAENSLPKTVQSKLFTRFSFDGKSGSSSLNKTSAKENSGRKRVQSCMLTSPVKSPPKSASLQAMFHDQNIKPSSDVSCFPKSSPISSLAQIKNDEKHLNSSPKRQQSEVEKVPCPVCTVPVVSLSMNRHLDICLASQDKKTALIPSKKKPLPKLVYNLLSDRDIRKRLKELGLNSQGDRQVMIKRHHEFTLYHNADCDSFSPKDTCDLVKEFEETQKMQVKLSSKSSSVSGQPMLCFTKHSKKEDIEKAHKDYAEQHKSQFKSLIRDVRRRMKLAGKKHTTHTSTSTPSEHAAGDGIQQQPEDLACASDTGTTNLSKRSTLSTPAESIDRHEQDSIENQTDKNTDSDQAIQNLSTVQSATCAKPDSETLDMIDAYNEDTDIEEDAGSCSDTYEFDTEAKCVRKSKVYPQSEKSKRALLPPNAGWQDTDGLEQSTSSHISLSFPDGLTLNSSETATENAVFVFGLSAENVLDDSVLPRSQNESHTCSVDSVEPQRRRQGRQFKPLKSLASIAQEKISSEEISPNDSKTQAQPQDSSMQSTGLSDALLSESDRSAEKAGNDATTVRKDGTTKDQACSADSHSEMSHEVEGVELTDVRKKIPEAGKQNMSQRRGTKSSASMEEHLNPKRRKKDVSAPESSQEDCPITHRGSEKESTCNSGSNQTIDRDQFGHSESDNCGEKSAIFKDTGDCRTIENKSHGFDLRLSDCEDEVFEKECETNIQIPDRPYDKQPKKQKLASKKQSCKVLKNYSESQPHNLTSTVVQEGVASLSGTGEEGHVHDAESPVVKLKSLLKKESDVATRVKKSVKFVGLPPRLSDFEYEQCTNNDDTSEKVLTNKDGKVGDLHAEESRVPKLKSLLKKNFIATTHTKKSVRFVGLPPRLSDFQYEQCGDNGSEHAADCDETDDRQIVGQSSTELIIDQPRKGAVLSHKGTANSNDTGRHRHKNCSGLAKSIINPLVDANVHSTDQSLVDGCVKKSCQKKSHKKKTSVDLGTSTEEACVETEAVAAESDRARFETGKILQFDLPKKSRSNKRKQNRRKAINTHSEKQEITENTGLSGIPVEGFTFVKELTLCKKVDGENMSSVETEEEVTEKLGKSKDKKDKPSRKKKPASKSDTHQIGHNDFCTESAVSENVCETELKLASQNKSEIINDQDISELQGDGECMPTDIQLQNQKISASIPETSTNVSLTSAQVKRRKRKRASEAVPETYPDTLEKATDVPKPRHKKKTASKSACKEATQTSPELSPVMPEVSAVKRALIQEPGDEKAPFDLLKNTGESVGSGKKKGKTSEVHKKTASGSAPELPTDNEPSGHQARDCASENIAKEIIETLSDASEKLPGTERDAESPKKAKSHSRKRRHSVAEREWQQDNGGRVDSDEEVDMHISLADLVKTKRRRL